MFKFLKRNRQSKNDEQQARIDFHYPACVQAISTYINEHQQPTGDDILRIAVNAKIVYELFRSVAGARDFAAPLITNGLAFYSELHGMGLDESAVRIKELVQAEVNGLARGDEKLALPAVKAAYIMSLLVGFDEALPNR